MAICGLLIGWTQQKMDGAFGEREGVAFCGCWVNYGFKKGVSESGGGIGCSFVREGFWGAVLGLGRVWVWQIRVCGCVWWRDISSLHSLVLTLSSPLFVLHIPKLSFYFTEDYISIHDYINSLSLSLGHCSLRFTRRKRPPKMSRRLQSAWESCEYSLELIFIIFCVLCYAAVLFPLPYSTVPPCFVLFHSSVPLLHSASLLLLFLTPLLHF